MKEHVAIIIEKDDKILFIKRSIKKKSLPGKWAFVSGTIENETPFETAERESFEELGVKIQPVNLLAELELPELNSKLFFIKCKILKGKPYIKKKVSIVGLDL